MSEKINVLIDCSHIKKKPDSPISLHIYAGRLMQGLDASTAFHPIVLAQRDMDKYIDSLAGSCIDKIFVNGNEKRTLSTKLDRILGLIPRSIEARIQEQNIKAVITPDFSPYSFTFPKKYHQHLVVHDLIAIHRRRGDQRYYIFSLWCATKRIPYMVSISENTRRELKAWSGRDSAVIHNSIPFDFCQSEQPVKELIGNKFILDVNRFDKYKNPMALVSAFSLIKDQIPHFLYLKGFVAPNNHDIDDVRELVSQLHLEDRVILDTTSRTEGEMRWLYTHADLFVTPSVEEGFGYTPIEAAVLKTPVLVSNIDTLKEVTQGKLQSFDPHSPEELAEKMLKMIANPPSEKEKDDIAMFFQKEYSLEKQIEQFTKVILKNIEGGRN